MFLVSAHAAPSKINFKHHRQGQHSGAVHLQVLNSIMKFLSLCVAQALLESGMATSTTKLQVTISLAPLSCGT